MNLAFRPEEQKARILALNAQVNALIDAEVGADPGALYPGPAERYSLSR
jgi:hypothetical protein